MKKIINTQNAPKAIGPYSQGIGFQNLVFTSGQIPVDPQTGAIPEGDIVVQAEQVMKNLQAVLEEGGSCLDNIIKTTCFLADMADFVRFNEVYSTYIKQQLPARSCVAVKELPKGSLCEVEAIAYVNTKLS